MGSLADIAAVAAACAGALAFVVWRFAVRRAPPGCAPGEEARPQVMIGSRLAQGLAQRKKK